MRHSLRVAAGTLVAVATLAAGGCSDITTLKQENPSQIVAATAYVPGNAALLATGASSELQCAYYAYVTGSGFFTEEIGNAQPAQVNYQYDSRNLPTSHAYGTGTCTGTFSIYTSLSRARGAADTTLAKLEGWTDAEVPNRTRLIGQVATYAGYSLTLLGEGMCSAAINVGPELTPAQIFAEAKTRFDKAIAAATTANDTPTLNLALVGRARTLLNLGDKANAAVDAAKIPSTFIFNTSTDASDNRRQNRIFSIIGQSGTATIEPPFRGVTWQGVADSRVVVTNSGRLGPDGVTQIWVPGKASSLTTPIAIAKWAEAQLIIAETNVAAGNLAGAATIINALHTRAGIPAYDGTGQTAAQVQAQIIEERRREFFLEGHRLGDLRRYNLAFIPAAGSPYPFGSNYGTQTCFPLPDVERVNNPHFAK